MGKLDGKVALVTGAGGGLGRTHALLLAQEGAAVVVNDLGGARDGSGGGAAAMADSVVAEIKAAGGQAAADYGSVADEAAAKAMVQACVDNFGKIDICINNAGILRDKSFKNMTNDMWDVRGRCAFARHLPSGESGLGSNAGARDRRAHRQHQLHLRADRQLWPNQLRRRQGRHRRPHPGAGAGGG